MHAPTAAQLTDSNGNTGTADSKDERSNTHRPSLRQHRTDRSQGRPLPHIPPTAAVTTAHRSDTHHRTSQQPSTTEPTQAQPTASTPEQPHPPLTRVAGSRSPGWGSKANSRGWVDILHVTSAPIPTPMKLLSTVFQAAGPSYRATVPLYIEGIIRGRLAILKQRARTA